METTSALARTRQLAAVLLVDKFNPLKAEKTETVVGEELAKQRKISGEFLPGISDEKTIGVDEFRHSNRPKGSHEPHPFP